MNEGTGAVVPLKVGRFVDPEIVGAQVAVTGRRCLEVCGGQGKHTLVSPQEGPARRGRKLEDQMEDA